METLTGEPITGESFVVTLTLSLGSRCTSRAVSRATFDLVFPTQDEVSVPQEVQRIPPMFLLVVNSYPARE